jgi:type III secretion protein O
LFQDLLSIKKFRETAASSEMVKKRAILDDRSRQTELARQTLEDHHRFRLRREDELFLTIKDQLVHLTDIEQMKQQVALLREKEALLHNRILEAEKLQKQALEALQQAQQVYAEAVRAREKFQQFIEVQITLERKEQEWKEEQEMEEFTSPTTTPEA